MRLFHALPPSKLHEEIQEMFPWLSPPFPYRKEKQQPTTLTIYSCYFSLSHPTTPFTSQSSTNSEAAQRDKGTGWDHCKRKYQPNWRSNRIKLLALWIGFQLISFSWTFRRGYWLITMWPNSLQFHPKVHFNGLGSIDLTPGFLNDFPSRLRLQIQALDDALFCCSCSTWILI